MRWTTSCRALTVAVPWALALSSTDAVAQVFQRDLWSGTYAGVTAGSGFGGQLGANVKIGNFIVGLEGEVKNGSPLTNIIPTSSAIADVNWTATGRARAGILVMPKLFVYALAGYGAANVDIKDIASSALSRQTLNGAQLGLGVEWKILDQLSLRLDYTQTNLQESAPITGSRGNLPLQSLQGGVTFRF